MAGRAHEFKRGAKTALPIVVGYFPIAVSYGVLAVQSGISLFHTLAMSVLVYAGASQFMAVGMIGMGVSALELITATFVLNFRHFVMSLSLMNVLKHVPSRWKAVLSYWITDETFAVTSMEAEKQYAQLNASYLCGLLVCAYLSWFSGSLFGGLLSMVIPSGIGESMSIGLYAMFIGLLIPAVRTSWRVGLIAGVSAGLCSIFYLYLSSGWAIVSATVLGGTLGIFLTKEEK